MRKQSCFFCGFVLLLFLVEGPAYSQLYMPGNSYYGRNNYIEYIAGSLPLIISVPHGGSLAPDEIPDRTCGDETVTDLYTINLAMEIADAINIITGCHPHIVICHLKRTKLDANRDLPEAACENEFAETAWNEFHAFIDDAKEEVMSKSGKGLFIDLHGHGHNIQRLELGYLLTGTQLRYPDATLNTLEYVNYSSIRSLAGSNISGLTHSGLLRGSTSLGSLFSSDGYPSVPGIDDPYPLEGQLYFSGGYNTVRHGSVSGGAIDAIQIECNQDVRFVESSRKDFAAIFGEVALDFLIEHYFPDLPQTYCNIVSAEKKRESQLHIYPNPFKNTLNLNISSNAEVSVCNLLGKMLYSKDISPGDMISLDKLDSGVYILVIRRDGFVIHREKIIKAGN